MRCARKEKGCRKLEIENKEDLWYLSQIIDPGDLVSSKTTRKIKIGEDGDRSQKVVKKTCTIEIMVERIEVSVDVLRISGKITKAPEDIPLSSYHTLSVGEFQTLSIIKSAWLKYQDDIIAEACGSRTADVLLVILDREEAFFARLRKYGYDVLSHLKGDVQKKRVSEKISGDFYKEIVEKMMEYERRTPFSQVIVGSPSFWKEELEKRIADPSLKGKVILATCSSVGRTAFDELLKRAEVRTALRRDKTTKEINAVEDLLGRIAVEGNAVYGEKETIAAGNAGAIERLLVVDVFIQEKREQGEYAQIDSLMKTVDATKGDIVIVSGSHEGGQKLKGIGGIGALTRYRF